MKRNKLFCPPKMEKIYQEIYNLRYTFSRAGGPKISYRNLNSSSLNHPNKPHIERA